MFTMHIRSTTWQPLAFLAKNLEFLHPFLLALEFFMLSLLSFFCTRVTRRTFSCSFSLDMHSTEWDFLAIFNRFHISRLSFLFAGRTLLVSGVLDIDIDTAAERASCNFKVSRSQFSHRNNFNLTRGALVCCSLTTVLQQHTDERSQVSRQRCHRWYFHLIIASKADSRRNSTRLASLLNSFLLFFSTPINFHVKLRSTRVLFRTFFFNFQVCTTFFLLKEGKNSREFSISQSFSTVSFFFFGSGIARKTQHILYFPSPKRSETW